MRQLLLVLAIAGMVACTSSEDGGGKSVTELGEPREAIGEDLMLALAQAKNFHHKAKVYMADAQPDAAIAAIREILSLRFPAGAPEAEDVRNDARAVLAKLLVGQGRLDEATSVIQEGLATKTRDSFFVANLHTVKSEIHYARAVKLGTDPAARAERVQAIEELDKSIKINQELIRQRDRR